MEEASEHNKKQSVPVLPWMRSPIDRFEVALENMDFTPLFPVQVAVWQETIGPGSCERDLCINSPTGSGKTLAYALPIVQMLSTRAVRCLRGLVVLPTRDLAVQRLNLKHVRGMLLYGPPGSGKTLIAQSICKFLNAKEPLTGCVRCIPRSIREENKELKVTYTSSYLMKLIPLLRAILENLHAFKIDGRKAFNNIFIIGTTNRKELIDEALLREGRIEIHVKVEYPDEQGRLQILSIYTTNMGQNFVLNRGVNLHEIACRTDGCSGSALASLVTRAHSYVVVHTVENGLLQHIKDDFKVTMNHFLRAIEDVKSGLQESDLEPSSNPFSTVWTTTYECARMTRDARAEPLQPSVLCPKFAGTLAYLA
ncbi:unnamed protein product [Camellia sinensis]